jgi:hypothetical protein
MGPQRADKATACQTTARAYASQTTGAIYIMVVKFRNTICPAQPQLSLHRRAALSSYSNGTRSYIAERTQCAVYIVRCLWYSLTVHLKKIGK